MALRTPARILLGLAALASAAAMTASAGAPSAKAASLGLACPDPTSTPFNDGHYYAAVPDGGFENGGAGWTLTGGAGVVAGNEPDMVGGPGQSHSLSLPAGSSATSPPMCIGLLSSRMRLYAQNTGAARSELRVQVIYNGGLGALLGGLGSTLRISDQADFSATATWSPTAPYPMLGGILPLLTRSVQFRFTPLSTGGNWRIDDVYLDPLMHR
ncbi:MAG TPA: hypothetical protein VFX13_13110 [Gaiellales bacterium]|nr:hypothetical protein [Gaiellales bacterium]